MRIAPHQDLWVATLLAADFETRAERLEALGATLQERVAAAECAQAIVLVTPTHGTWREDRLAHRPTSGWRASTDTFQHPLSPWREVPGAPAEAFLTTLNAHLQTLGDADTLTLAGKGSPDAWFVCELVGEPRLLTATHELGRSFLEACWPDRSPS